MFSYGEIPVLSSVKHEYIIKLTEIRFFTSSNAQRVKNNDFT